MKRHMKCSPAPSILTDQHRVVNAVAPCGVPRDVNVVALCGVSWDVQGLQITPPFL